VKNNGRAGIHQLRIEFKSGTVPTITRPDWPGGKLPFSVDGSDPASWDPKLDAVAASPESHNAIYEDEDVRVLSVVVPAGVTQPMHTHRYPSIRIGYGERPLVMQERSANGALRSLELRGAGTLDDVNFVAAQNAHAATQIEGTTRLIRVEFKHGFPNP
jgi:hypothetical protein